VNSFDLKLACDLSRRLTGMDTSSDRTEWMEDTQEYSRFPAAGVKQQDQEPAVTSRQEPSPEAAPLQAPTEDFFDAPEFVTWGDMLSWCMELSKARSAFVLDSDGFVIAYKGSEPTNGFEGAGAELVYSMDHFARVDPNAGDLKSVNLIFEGISIFGYRVRITEAMQLVVGIISDEPLTTQMKIRIADTTFQGLAKLM